MIPRVSSRFAALMALLLVGCICTPAPAQSVLTKDYSVTVVDTATNSQSFVVRGPLLGVWIDAPANATGTVSVATRGSTVFSAASVAADVTYYPVVQNVNSTGTLVSAQFVPVPLAGSTTVQVIGGSAGTNTWPVKLLFAP